LRCFRHQFSTNATYRAFCEGRQRTPGTVSHWEDVPAVPATAFKQLELIAEGSGPPEASFLTSGTSRGTGRRGRHPVRSLALYRSSLLPTFKAYVVPDLDRIVFISLIPSPVVLPDSSLSFMVGAAADQFASEVHWLVDASGALDSEGLIEVAAKATRAGQPVLLLGTAFAFVHALERLGDAGLRELAAGSRIMETGGFKGRGRDIPRLELHSRLSDATGVPPSRIVNEYGMTELLSQLYEPVLAEGLSASGMHVPPPWLRVRALDPHTLEPMQEGREGILAFFDLANLGSVCHVLTEDVGSVQDGRVRLAGRVAGAEPRGCSRAMDDLMAVADSAR